ncbi:MAG: AI-2E family transporter [Saprospiraceae bacterium]|nr:AI-2E family transporter [Saprospiraceae bacterium]
MNFSFQKLFYAIATIFSLLAIMVIGKPILISLGFALLLSFILYPLTKRFESWRLNYIIAAFLSILVLFILFGGVVLFFSTQISQLPNDLSNFQDKLMVLFTDLIVYINANINLEKDLKSAELLEQIRTWVQSVAFPVAEDTFYSTTRFLAGLLATVIYTFLLLIYRKGLTQAFVQFAPEANRDRVLNMLKNVQKVGQKYLTGVVTLILILGFANSIGLWIIGIDSPFLFGFLAAAMSIIPYVGTTLGASIPVLYAFMTNDSLWIPLIITGMFWSIQLIESNFLGPKVIGSILSVNALAAILSLIIGASVWGIAGMILFLPFTAMLKVVCEEFEVLRPVALLIGSQSNDDDDIRNKPVRKWVEKNTNWLSQKENMSST